MCLCVCELCMCMCNMYMYFFLLSPVSAVHIHMGMWSSLRAWVTYRWPHTQIKVIPPPTLQQLSTANSFLSLGLAPRTLFSSMLEYLAILTLCRFYAGTIATVGSSALQPFHTQKTHLYITSPHLWFLHSCLPTSPKVSLIFVGWYIRHVSLLRLSILYYSFSHWFKQFWATALIIILFSKKPPR